MPGPAFGDDDWDELARELNVQKAPPPDRPPHTPDLHPITDDAPAPVADLGLPEDDPDAFAGEEAPADEAGEYEGEEGQPGEGQPGTGRKRRRRRRRRKKGGPGEGTAGETAEAAPAAGEAEEPVASYRGSVRAAARPEPEEGGFEEEAAEVGEEGGVPLAAEEDTGGEMLRDLIASWSVPSWDEIVGGLYRPER